MILNMHAFTYFILFFVFSTSELYYIHFMFVTKVESEFNLKSGSALIQKKHQPIKPTESDSLSLYFALLQNASIKRRVFAYLYCYLTLPFVCLVSLI
ncbi:MAG: hypothetical protein EXX96DRAFT_300036 [Benjaminiella poitrasii]|nr:MAG: hypothetical protein EXX96DRAFT_300036 [Benjaminiella poitrasii]